MFDNFLTGNEIHLNRKKKEKKKDFSEIDKNCHENSTG
jgi:hypothetical protein